MTIKSKLSDKDRNQPCPCGSGLKQKLCHGDPKKLQVCNQVAQFYMMQLIAAERKKCGLEPYAYTCETCGKGTDNPVVSTMNGDVLLCPVVECGNLVKKNMENVKQKETESKIILES